MRVLAVHLSEASWAAACAQRELLAEGLLEFGPTVEIAELAERRLVRLDVTGCAQLFARPPARGEAVIAQRVLTFLQRLGLHGHVAVAEGAELAGLFAQVACKPLVIEREDTLRALAELPLSLLPLAPADAQFLIRLGWSRIGDLMQVAPDSLSARLGASARQVLGLLRGEDPRPLIAHPKPLTPELHQELEVPTASSSALLFLVKGAASVLWGQMPGRSLRRVSLRLEVDRGARRESVLLSSQFAPELDRCEDVVAALRSKIERSFVEAEAGSDGFGEVRGFQLRFDELVPTAVVNLSLCSSEARAARALPKLLAELRASLGEAKLGCLQVQDAWDMAARSGLVAREQWRPAEAHWLNVQEPTRFVLPEPLFQYEPLRLLVLLERNQWFAASPPRCEVMMAWSDERVVCAERTARGCVARGVFD